MKNEEVYSNLEQRAYEGDLKFHNTLLSIALASLALSFQFSPKPGFVQPVVLVIGWILLFLSAVLGGWRLMAVPGYIRINLKAIKEENQLISMKVMTPNSRNFDSNTLEPISYEEAVKRKNSMQERVDKAWIALKKGDQLAKYCFRAQVLFLILGIGLIGYFTAYNLLIQPLTHLGN